ncbi:hypothetical protein AB205_0087130, partial [Aquarana catesbeiana]
MFFCLSAEKGDVKSKTEALKKVIIMILNGEKLPGLLMTIIRFVLPLQDHTIKKLLLVFWEIVPKTTPDGKLLQEMILVCDAYRKVCHANPSERARFIRCIYNLLQSSSPAVKYEAAGTLVTLSSAPTAIKAAAQCYIDLIIKESDNNVKLIVLDRLVELKDHPSHERVLQDLVMDILRVLTTPDLEVRKKTLQLALDLVSSRNVEELVIVLKKEVIKTNNVTEHEDTDKYRQLLVRTLHSCSVRFPDMAANVIPVVGTTFTVPIVETEIKKESGETKPEEEVTVGSTQRLVTEMGTYATQSALSSARPTKKEEERFVELYIISLSCRPPLRGFLLEGDFFVAAALATTLTKIALRYVALVPEKKLQNSFVSEAMLLMATILHVGKSSLPKKQITDDDVDRISLCLKVLSECSPLMSEIFNKECRQSLSNMLHAKLEEEKLSQKKESEKRNVTVQADDPISFMQLTAKSEMSSKEDQFQLSLLAAMGTTQRKEAADPLASKLNK